jgi:hypothetical protein
MHPNQWTIVFVSSKFEFLIWLRHTLSPGECPAGRYDDGSGCRPCDFGTFKTAENAFELCEPCPENFTTQTTGSQFLEDCSVREYCNFFLQTF